ncbi:hypothetical protein SNEBB_011483 [Seison nebaliae]|nr:hypothetical protein SNEBB_011483 [Seison nebaliae]
MIYFHSLRQAINNKRSIQVDIVEDLVHVNEMAKWSHKTGMIIIGGGVIKHHICSANLMRNGADYTVYLNIASEYDGSDSGARPDEVVSWGKVRENSESVKVFGEATILFPMIVAQTFFRYLADKR